MAGETRWLFSPRTDVLAFFGAALASFALVLAAPALGITGDTPPGAWLLLVVGIDVAHVWSTLYRVYLDGEEVRRRPLLYAGAPVVAFGLGVFAHQLSPAFFWRALAYVAVWHFIRQQAGWMVLYGRKARSAPWRVHFDRAAMYAATLGPVVWWHANLPRPFWWFKEGDFVGGLPQAVGTGALVLHALVLGAWLVVTLVPRLGGEKVHSGKLLLAAATWLVWFGGIVWAKSDFAFTAMNVVLHGVPYLVLLYTYAQGRQAEGGYGRLNTFVRLGVPTFLTLLLALAFLEEFAWDRLVWAEHPMFFGATSVVLPPALLSLVVPLLSVPQVTHYLLDGFVWRTSADPSLPSRLGWGPAPAPKSV